MLLLLRLRKSIRVRFISKSRINLTKIHIIFHYHRCLLMPTESMMPLEKLPGRGTLAR